MSDRIQKSSFSFGDLFDRQALEFQIATAARDRAKPAPKKSVSAQAPTPIPKKFAGMSPSQLRAAMKRPCVLAESPLKNAADRVRNIADGIRKVQSADQPQPVVPSSMKPVTGPAAIHDRRARKSFVLADSPLKKVETPSPSAPLGWSPDLDGSWGQSWE